MKAWASRVGSGCAILVLFGMLIGCATPATIDWNNRVGAYTYDQAVLDMGPPDKSAKLQDGTVVAEWVEGRAPSTVVGFGLGAGYYWGSGADYHVVPGYDRLLRLTFAPNGQLQTWRKLSR